MSLDMSEVGLIGLAVMGQNLALNIASKGFTISVWNRTSSRTDETRERAEKEKVGKCLRGFSELKEFVDSISKPRKVILLIQAGAPVDAALKDLIPLLSDNDLIIDGGNEWFANTNRRVTECESKGIRYMGMGVSGGEAGARMGPSLMPGGSRSGYDDVQHILNKIAAQVSDGPCVSYVGKEGSGHYVKMVHNGIEYADMQIIAEAYSIMARVGGLNNDKLRDVFGEWNSDSSELKSYLIEITCNIFGQKDDLETPNHLIDMIEDVAGSKGTGKWTVQEGAERGVPVPSIEAALAMRNMSALKHDRTAASRVYPDKPFLAGGEEAVVAGGLGGLVDAVRTALYCAKICCYAQGFMLLRTMSNEQKWDLNLGQIARTWKGGCIIRAVFLDRIKEAYHKRSELPSLLMDDYFSESIKSRIGSLRSIVEIGVKHGIAVPAMAASLAYFDAYRTPQLPLNLVQAQRDYFGAHTYRRTDRAGAFHCCWTNSTPSH
eukprot:GHVQ01033334.1.p1 GENE.GHVQ01033334.1~~GHVQ01033334.1.p1  ORF type:complete len:490 (-),score=61.54 GHVQ01033334.1:563-2032(-)